MNIGLVLSKVPGYSETFFRTKITGLVNDGHRVYLFVNSKKEDSFYGASVIRSYPVKDNRLVMAILLPCVLLLSIIMNLKNTIRYFKLLYAEGLGITKIVRSIYINAHILKYELNWLHFGFTTIALEREFVAKAIGASMAVSIRGFDIAIYPLKHQGCYNKVWSNVDKVHTISDDLMVKAFKTGLNERVKVSKITPAIDFNKFYHYRNSFSPAGKIKILSIGRLHWIKGFEYGLETMAKLKSKGYGFKYSIVGGGRELERLKFAVYQLGLEECVEFKGELSHNEVINELFSSDIYFQPSIHEGFCNAVLEAQAAGCMCVVSDVGGLPENIISEKTGWTVPARNTDAFANMLESVINLPENRKREVVENAQRRVEEEFSIEKQIKEFVNFYQE